MVFVVPVVVATVMSFVVLEELLVLFSKFLCFLFFVVFFVVLEVFFFVHGYTEYSKLLELINFLTQ